MNVAVTGLDSVGWGSVEDTPTRRLSTVVNPSCPIAGESHWVQLWDYHNTPIGGRVWLLYKPGLSAVNGWEDHPAELDESAIVECEVIARHNPDWKEAKLLASRDELRQSDPATFAGLAKMGFFNPSSPADEYKESADQYRGWVQVVCHRVVPLIEIPQHFPETQMEFLPPTIDTPCHPVASATLEYWCHGDNGGGAIEWWVTTKTSPRRLLLYCLHISSDPFEIHNMILPE